MIEFIPNKAKALIKKANNLSAKIDKRQKALGHYLPTTDLDVARFDSYCKQIEAFGLTLDEHVKIWE